MKPSRPFSRHFRGDALRGPQNEADQLILDWCNRFGLLGLVPVLSNSIRPPIQVEAGYYNAGTGEVIPSEYSRTVKVRHHFRDGGIWHPWVSISSPSGTTPTDTDDAVKEIKTSAAKRGVTWFDWKTHIYEEKDLKHIRDFFLPTAFGLPSEIEEEIEIPCPKTRNFWECYGEPVRQFTRWAENFALAVDYLSRWSGGARNADESRAVEDSYWALGGLAQSAAPWFRFHVERNTIDEARVSAGLLASYALMFLWDRMEGRRALRCQNCNAYFVSNEPRARYCQERCRNTAQTRRHRAKKAHQK
jgi:hypothetical protein